MLLGILLRRKIVETLMGTQLMIKRDPDLGCSQKLPQGVIRSSIGYRAFEQADKALGIVIIGRGSCPTHGLHKAFLQEQGARLESTVLLALITVPAAARSAQPGPYPSLAV